MQGTVSNIQRLPLLQWKKNRPYPKFYTNKSNIKFSVISQQSMPYLEEEFNLGPSRHLLKGFAKCRRKLNGGEQLNSVREKISKRSMYESREQKFSRQKKKMELQKVINKKNFEQHKLKLQYENLKINSIIECATQQLVEKQNKMLNGMVS